MAKEKKTKIDVKIHEDEPVKDSAKSEEVPKESKSAEEPEKKEELTNTAEDDKAEDNNESEQSEEVAAEEVEDEPKENDTSEETEPQEETTEEASIEEATEKPDEATENEDSQDEAKSVDDEPASESDESKDEQSESEVATENDELDKDKTIEEAMHDSDASQDVFTPNPEIDKAVDEIVQVESDESLRETDAKLAALQKGPKKSFGSKIKSGFSYWWNTKGLRYGSLLVLFLICTAAILLPNSRYWILNTAGVRVEASTVVVDSQTGLPLANINVEIQSNSQTTDEDGRVEFEELKLGTTIVEITKIGYATESNEVVLGWGSNQLVNQEIVATGEQFTFMLKDWQSSEVVLGGKAVAGENSAKSDDEGKIVLTVGEENLAEVVISIEAEGYRSEEFKIDELTSRETEVPMVPSKKHLFISNRNNQYDLYKVDVDGENEELLIEATGKEREVPTILPHPTKDILAFVSSREGDENPDGFLLDGLYIVDAISGESEKIARSEQLRLIGWTGDELVFWQVVEGRSAGNPQRSKLISYNIETTEKADLAAANYFNDTELVGDMLYYAVSSFAVPRSQAKMYSIKIGEEDSNLVIDNQVWNIFRTEYDKLLISAENQKWYEIVGGVVSETGAQPAPTPRRFVDNPSSELTAWVDILDGQGVLLSSSIEDFNQEPVLSAPGLSEVLYWANDETIIYRVVNSIETADYLVNINSGEPVKIRDVTAAQRYLYN